MFRKMTTVHNMYMYMILCAVWDRPIPKSSFMGGKKKSSIVIKLKTLRSFMVMKNNEKLTNKSIVKQQMKNS